jgi:hypothetical protein
MDNVTNIYGKGATPQMFLTGLFILYLLMGFHMPDQLASIVDTPVGKILIAVGALSLFAYTNPLLGVLGVLVAYKLIITATQSTGLGMLELYTQTEEKKWSGFPQIHKYSYTLEQEMVKKMAPIVQPDSSGKATYKPSLENLHDASSINNTGSI